MGVDMNLKERMAADISAVFLNLAHFAKTHDINGNSVICLVDDDISKAHTGGDQYDGVFLVLKKIFVKSSDLPKRPRQGKEMKLDGSPYIVLSCTENEGMYEILIGLNEI